MPITVSIGREGSYDKMKKSKLYEITQRGRQYMDDYTGPKTPKIGILAALYELNIPSTAEEISKASNVNKDIAIFNLEQLRQIHLVELSKMGAGA